MVLAMEREQSTCRSLLPRVRAVLADPEPMLARLVRGCIALAFTACVLADACMHRLHAPAQLHGTDNFVTYSKNLEDTSWLMPDRC